MTEQEILELSPDYAVMDDFGYIVFHSDEKLLDFAFELLARREQYEMQSL